MAIEKTERVFMEMDRLDQQQIVLAVTGEVAKELVYRVRGRDGISWAGINHIAFMMGDIKVEPWVEWESVEMHGERYWSATVRAVNERYNLASLGTAEAPERMEVYDRDPQGGRIPDGAGGLKKHLDPDPFCRRKALSMAQRNAKKAVIPAAVLAKWLGYFLDLKAGKKVGPPFNAKVVEAEYKVKTRAEPPPRRAPPIPPHEDVGEPEPEKRTQLKLGKVDLNVIVYNLQAIGVGEEDVSVTEEEDGFYITPARKLGDDAYYPIQHTLEPMGAEWHEDRQLWVIWKEAEG